MKSVIIKSLLVAASLAATLLLTPGVRAATELMDQVVAIVDDDIIMASELRERADALQRVADERRFMRRTRKTW